MENPNEMNLFMVIIGGKPEDRVTEQHDVFFGIGKELKDLVPDMYSFWPALEGRMHIDSWRKVNKVSQFKIEITRRDTNLSEQINKLFFVNLGGYKPNDMEEYHYKELVVAKNLADATRVAKESIFWKHHESSHIDDKYGIDVDDVYEVADLLSPKLKAEYQIQIGVDNSLKMDRLEVGYLKISKLLSS